MIKRRYWLFQRGTVFYFEDSHTGQQKSLRTRNRKDAERMLLAMNEAAEHPQLNLSLARAYLANHDREYADRKWSTVMERFADRSHPATRRRSQTAMRSRPFDLIRDKRLIETTSEDFLAVIKAGGNSTQTHLKALHNFALGMGWLPWEILPKKLWPPVRKKPRRAITLEEHERIVEGGATDEKKGLFEIADGGTLFLDEITETPMSLQSKLLRALQEGEIRQVGATASKYVDVRIVAATNRNLEEEVKKGTFREDLYYRLKVFPIRLPPLRERRDDIALLATHFSRGTPKRSESRSADFRSKRSN